MSAKKLDLIVGAIFFFAMGLLGWVTIFKAQTFGDKKLYRVKFPKVFGLKEGGRVRCEGKDVGEVRRLELIENYVLATVEVDSDVEIYRLDSKILVTPFSPLGGRIIEITRGKPQSEKLPDWKPGEEGKILEGEAEGELLSALTTLINDNRKRIDNIFENIEAATDRLDEPTNVAGKILTDKQFATRFDHIAENLDKATKSIEAVAGRIERGEGVVGELTVEGTRMHKDSRDAVTNAKDALDEFRKVGKSMNEGEGLVNVILNDKKFADDWKGTSSNINEITGTVAEGKGIMRLFSEDEVYEDLRGITKHGRSIAQKVDEGQGPLGVLISDEQAGKDIRDTLSNVADTTKDLNEGKGALGALINDEELGKKTREVFSDAARVIREFRDSIEDTREQAPVSAFLGSAFAAF